MTPKSRPADREILRDATHVLRLDRRDWSKETMVAHAFWEAGVERSPFGTNLTIHVAECDRFQDRIVEPSGRADCQRPHALAQARGKACFTPGGTNHN
jgi:hypothetical protein